MHTAWSGPGAGMADTKVTAGKYAEAATAAAATVAAATMAAATAAATAAAATTVAANSAAATADELCTRWRRALRQAANGKS